MFVSKGEAMTTQTMTTLTMTTVPTSRELPATELPISVLRVGYERWRVRDERGRALGLLCTIEEDAGARYQAFRFHAPSRRFREIGRFWRAEDALECLWRSR